MGHQYVNQLDCLLLWLVTHYFGLLIDLILGYMSPFLLSKSRSNQMLATAESHPEQYLLFLSFYLPSKGIVFP